MAKIALGTWAWGAGAFGGDTVFGSKTDVETLKPVFEAAMKAGLSLGTRQRPTVWASRSASWVRWLKSRGLQIPSNAVRTWRFPRSSHRRLRRFTKIRCRRAAPSPWCGFPRPCRSCRQSVPAPRTSAHAG